MTQETTYPMIKITSELFGVIELPSWAELIGVDGNNREYPLDVWTSIGDYLDINVFDTGEPESPFLQASIYPVKDGRLNVLHEIEHIMNTDIEIIKSCNCGDYEACNNCSGMDLQLDESCPDCKRKA